MAAYLARRLVSTVILLAAVAGVTFLLIRLAPGDAATTLGGSAGGDPRSLAELRHRLGLDRSVLEQLGSYLASLFRGDLGFSVVRGRPVLEVIVGRLPATLLLAATSIMLGTVGGVLLGMVSAARQGTRWDAGVSVATLVAYSLPVFWIGQLVVALFAVQLGWLPTGGMSSITSELSGAARVLDLARHLILPTLTLSVLLLGLVVRTTRISVIETLNEEWVRAVRSKGLRERRILFRHVLRNALRPVVTVVAGNVALLLTGAVLIEVVYSWPGLGRLLFDSVLARDNPVLVGLLLFSAFAVSMVNLMADLVHAALDPRVRPW